MLLYETLASEKDLMHLSLVLTLLGDITIIIDIVDMKAVISILVITFLGAANSRNLCS